LFLLDYLSGLDPATPAIVNVILSSPLPHPFDQVGADLDRSNAAGCGGRQCEAKLTLTAPLPNGSYGRTAAHEWLRRATPPLRFLPMNLEGDE
jgi:hypothetical protein